MKIHIIKKDVYDELSGIIKIYAGELWGAEI